MNKLTLDNIEKVIKEYETSHPEENITNLGNGLYKVGSNLICGESMLDEIYKEILKEIKK